MKSAAGIILLKWNEEMGQVALALLHQTGEQECQMCVSKCT